MPPPSDADLDKLDHYFAYVLTVPDPRKLSFFVWYMVTTHSFGHSSLTFWPEFHMYTCMHAFARFIASHHTVKVHDVTAKQCAQWLIDPPHAPALG